MPRSWSGPPASPGPSRLPRSASSPRSTSSPADAGLAQRTTLMPALDIFGSSAFTMVALTDAINKMPYVPGRIGQLGLFREQGVSTTSVMIEEREGSLNLVETTARGAPAVQNTTNKRKARSLVVPHIALDDTSPAPGVIKKKCHDVRRKIEDELGAAPYDHIHAICGADFFDDLITHSEVTKAYDRYLDGAFLRQGQARGSFEYSGIVFEEYRGRVGTVGLQGCEQGVLLS